MARRSSALLPLWSVPLVLAVGVVLWPAIALAGSPAPDPIDSSGAFAAGLAPDPAPTVPSTVSPRSDAIVVRTAPANAVSIPRLATPPAPATKKVGTENLVRHAQEQAAPRAQVLDAPPIRVDLHPELGAVARSLPNDSMALMAGIALLVAAVVAASAIALTVVAARPPKSAT